VIEVNLIDRSRFLYPMLIGRDAIIAYNALIDPSKRNLQKDTCSIPVKDNK